MALSAVLLVTAASAAGCGGTAKVVRSADVLRQVAVHGPKLSGDVQVVAYSKRNVRICIPYAVAVAAMFPQPMPACQDGLRAIGVDTSMLTSHVAGKPGRWGYVYLVGRYRNGTFTVISQRLHGPARQPAGETTFDTPPCPTPHGGWRHQGVDVRPFAGMEALRHYRTLAHHRDILSVAFFDRGDVLTVASTHPARTRAVLGPHWPRQLCVVKARFAPGISVMHGTGCCRSSTSRGRRMRRDGAGRPAAPASA